MAIITKMDNNNSWAIILRLKKNGSMKDVKKAVVDIIDSAIVTFE